MNFVWSPEGPVSQIHSPHLHIGAPGIVSDLIRSVQKLKWECAAESNGKLPHLFNPYKAANFIYTWWKGNKCHPFNSCRGWLKGPIYIYNMGTKHDSFLSKRCSLFCFIHALLLIGPIARDNAKKFTSLGLSYKDVILFSKNILPVQCSVRKIKEYYMLIFWSESRGNTVEKAKCSLWLRKQSWCKVSEMGSWKT